MNGDKLMSHMSHMSRTSLNATLACGNLWNIKWEMKRHNETRKTSEGHSYVPHLVPLACANATEGHREHIVSY